MNFGSKPNNVRCVKCGKKVKGKLVPPSVHFKGKDFAANNK